MAGGGAVAPVVGGVAEVVEVPAVEHRGAGGALPHMLAIHGEGEVEHVAIGGEGEGGADHAGVGAAEGVDIAGVGGAGGKVGEPVVGAGDVD